MKTTKHILYLSYDGLTDALGQSQVLSYILGLAQKGLNYTIISFEKDDAYKKNKDLIQASIGNSNIKWIPLSYTANPPIFSTIYDVRKMKKIIYSIVKNTKVDVIHCRGYMTSIAGLKLKRRYGVKFIFDMRGFFADEKLEGGYWNPIIFKPVYKYFKKKEKAFFYESDVIISLTESGAKEIISSFNQSEKKVEIIPTCVDMNIFQPFSEHIKAEIRNELNVPTDAKIFIYSGSLGGNYDVNILFDAFRVFLNKYPNSFLLILSKTVEKNTILDNVEFSTRIIHRSVPFKKVSNYLIASDIGFIFYIDGFSLIARAPTKLAEYWACGIPVIVFGNIGDTRKFIDKYPKNGLCYDNTEGLSIKLDNYTLSPSKQELRKSSETEFSLKKGVDSYYRILTSL